MKAVGRGSCITKARNVSRWEVLLLPVLLSLSQVACASDLETGFSHPTGDAQPLVWWHWINGNVTKEGIRADLEDMQRVGLGGADPGRRDLHAQGACALRHGLLA